MSSADKESSCLVARAVPCAVPSQPLYEPKIEEKPKDSDTDALADSLRKLNVNSTTTTSNKKSAAIADPGDFVTLQSLRSSALARKTNTTSKFGRDGASLFADLLLNEKEEPKKEEKPTEKSEEESKAEEPKESAEKSDKENDEGEKKSETSAEEADLLSRGPVRVARNNVSFHPYTGSKPYPNSNESYEHYAAYGHPNQYEYGQWSTNNREVLSSSSTPDTMISDLGYSSASTTTSPQQQQCTSTTYLMSKVSVGASASKDDAELPDALSDFILKYSRSYRRSDQAEDGTVLSPKSGGRPSPSVESNLCDSPLSAGSAPESSPSAPHGGITGPSTPSSEYRGYNRMGPLRTQLPSAQYTAYLGRQNNGQPAEQHARPAKEVLRKLIRSEEMDDAWAWTCKCLQSYPGALCYQDKDKDTLLHIVTVHLDLAKIYALVEQMLKTDADHKPFDMKNRYSETPLFLAVEKRHNEVVDYFLEAGANPNSQNSRPERDGPLHFAASRGLSEIVKTICSYGTTNLNLTNGMGLTPLLCAVKNHGVYDEDGGFIIDNTQTIQYLLKFGADPLLADSTNGRTAIHYATDRMAPEIIDIFKNNLDEELMSTLVNQVDNNKETALENVQALNTDENIRLQLCLTLIMCGANNNGSPTASSPSQ